MVETDSVTAEANREKSNMTEFFKETWTQALLKVEAAEEEVGKMLHRAGEAAGWGPEEVRKVAYEFAERLKAQRKEFERTLEEGIARAVSRLKVPRRDEIDALWGRLARVGDRIAALQARKRAH